MGPVPLQFLATSVGLIVALLVLAVVIALLRSSVVIVYAYEQKALTVLGEYRKLLELD